MRKFDPKLIGVFTFYFSLFLINRYLDQFAGDNTIRFKAFFLLIFTISFVIIHEIVKIRTWSKLSEYELNKDLKSRISFNPFKNINFTGFLTILIGGIHSTPGGMNLPGISTGFGRELKTDFSFMKNPRKSLFLTHLSGLVFYLVNGLLFALLSHILSISGILTSVQKIFIMISMINLNLFIFNLLPIMPLDGGYIIFSMLPFSKMILFSKMEKKGQYIILLIVFLKILQPVIIKYSTMILSSLPLKLSMIIQLNCSMIYV